MLEEEIERGAEAQYLPRTELLCLVSLSCGYHQESLGYHPLMVYVDDPTLSLEQNITQSTIL